MKRGYGRVSSIGQELYGNSLDSQEQALREAGADVVYREVFTGTAKHRPQLDKLLSDLQAGDTLMVTKLDRIARSAAKGCELVNELIERGVVVHVLNMGVMDNTPTGKLCRTMLFAFAEFERDMIVQRTSEGKAIAKAANPNYKEGRKRIETDGFEELLRRQRNGEITADEGAKMLGISKRTWYKRAKEYEAA